MSWRYHSNHDELFPDAAQAAALAGENETLKAEVKKLRELSDWQKLTIDELRAECQRLRDAPGNR
jgi:hypothetical protein